MEGWTERRKRKRKKGREGGGEEEKRKKKKEIKKERKKEGKKEGRVYKIRAVFGFLCGIVARTLSPDFPELDSYSDFTQKCIRLFCIHLRTPDVEESQTEGRVKRNRVKMSEWNSDTTLLSQHFRKKIDRYPLNFPIPIKAPTAFAQTIFTHSTFIRKQFDSPNFNTLFRPVKYLPPPLNFKF